MDNNLRLAKEIMKYVGGEENIISLNHCSTRLRLKITDEEKFNIDKIKQIEGVLDIVKSMGGYQIIIGNNVAKVYNAILKHYHIKTDAKAGRVSTNPFDALLNALSDIMSPVFPAVIAAGLFSAIATVWVLCGMSAESSTYKIVYTASQVPFYFLPFLAAYGAARHWKLNPILALTLAGILLHPDMLTLLSDGSAVSLFGLPVTPATYSSSLIPMILTCWAMKYIGSFIEDKCPDSIRYVMVPFITMVVMIPIMLCITGPVGSWIGELMKIMLVYLSEKVPFVGTIIVGSIVPFLVLTGSHLALIPLELQSFTTLGYESMIMPAFIGLNFSQFAVSLAVFLKARKKSLKATAFSTGLTAFLTGTTEPTLYGISIRFKKPLIATFIGCIANALFCAIFNVKEYSWGAPGFFTMVNFIDPKGSNNIYFAIGAVVVTIVVTFIATWFLGFDESNVKEDENEFETKNNLPIDESIITSPISGEVYSLQSIDDPVFSTNKMGEGILLIPKEGNIYSPFDGEVIVIPPTYHAIGIRNQQGLELLIHVGLDSDQAADEFTPNVKIGDHVRRGDLLLRFDIVKLKNKGYRLETPIIITNMEKNQRLVKTDAEFVHTGDNLLVVI